MPPEPPAGATGTAGGGGPPRRTALQGRETGGGDVSAAALVADTLQALHRCLPHLLALSALLYAPRVLSILATRYEPASGESPLPWLLHSVASAQQIPLVQVLMAAAFVPLVWGLLGDHHPGLASDLPALASRLPSIVVVGVVLGVLATLLQGLVFIGYQLSMHPDFLSVMVHQWPSLAFLDRGSLLASMSMAAGAVVAAGCAFFVAGPVLLIEGVGPLTAFRRSLHLTAGHRWAVAALVPLVLAAVMLNSEVQMRLDYVPAEWSPRLPFRLLGIVLLSLVAAVLPAVAATVAYHRLRQAEDRATDEDLVDHFD